MAPARDLTGQRFGRLVALRRGKKTGYWEVHCDCGTDYAVYGGHLTQQRQRSCGCIQRLKRAASSTGLPLGRGKVALVDASDLKRARLYLWSLDSSGYPHTLIRGRKVRLHRFLLGRAGRYLDHWNEDKLDNRRANLRKASGSQNVMNTSLRADNATGFKGVSVYQNRWRARIRAHDVTTFLGYFQSKEEAARAYDAAARRLHGVFARLNFPTMNEQAARR